MAAFTLRLPTFASHTASTLVVIWRGVAGSGSDMSLQARNGTPQRISLSAQMSTAIRQKIEVHGPLVFLRWPSTSFCLPRATAKTGLWRPAHLSSISTQIRRARYCSLRSVSENTPRNGFAALVLKLIRGLLWKATQTSLQKGFILLRRTNASVTLANLCRLPAVYLRRSSSAVLTLRSRWESTTTAFLTTKLVDTGHPP